MGGCWKHWLNRGKNGSLAGTVVFRGSTDFVSPSPAFRSMEVRHVAVPTLCFVKAPPGPTWGQVSLARAKGFRFSADAARNLAQPIIPVSSDEK
jgi:hypothetical protein